MRCFGIALIAALISSSAAMADKLPLDAISTYMTNLRTVEGVFTQINDDGSIDTGKIYIKRPGRARFEYNPPLEALVVVGSNSVVVDDPKSNQPPESFPLSRTPLSIILADRVDLGRARMVTGHDFDGTATTVTAQDPDNPDFGSIQLKFTSDPVQLRQWIIRDGAGGATTVVLGALKTGGTLPNRLFDVGSPGQGPSR